MSELVNQKLKAALLMARGYGGVLGGPEVETKIPVRYVIQGPELPTLSDHHEELKNGTLIGELVVNKITPTVMQDEEAMAKLVRPFMSSESLEYIDSYVQRHGVETGDPVINRTDMLLTADGLKANEINPDAPEGYGLTKAGEAMQNMVNGKKPQAPLYRYFHWAQAKALKERGIKNVVIPYWTNSYTSPIDAPIMAEDLREIGINAEARPARELGEDEAHKYDAVLRTYALSTPFWEANSNLPLFKSDRWLDKFTYPAPWTDIAALKHWFALLHKMDGDPALCKAFGISKNEIAKVSQVLLPTDSVLFSHRDEILGTFSDGRNWVTKETMSSHGDGFHDAGAVDAKTLALNGGKAFGDHVRQHKAECVGSSNILVLHPNGDVRQEKDWLMDMDPMGSTKDGVFVAISRICKQHPINIAGANGGGSWNPLIR